MKIFRKLFLFFVVAKLFDLGLAATLDYCYKRSTYGEIGGNLNAYLQEKTCDTLFVGASRMQNHIDPQYFGKEAYNLSHQQMHILFHTALVDELDRQHKLPTQLLVLHIEAEDFLPQNDSVNQTDIHFLRFYYRQNEFIRHEINATSSTEFLKYTMDSYRHSNNVVALLSNYLQRSNERIGTKGYFGLNPKVSDFSAEKTTVVFENKTELSKSGLAVRCLKHLQKICSKKGIRLLLLTAPLYESDANYKILSQKVSDYLQKQGISYLNYAQYPAFTKDLWYDGKHLNKAGSVVFTQLVKRDLAQLKLSK